MNIHKLRNKIEREDNIKEEREEKKKRKLIKKERDFRFLREKNFGDLISGIKFYGFIVFNGLIFTLFYNFWIIDLATSFFGFILINVFVFLILNNILKSFFNRKLIKRYNIK